MSRTQNLDSTISRPAYTPEAEEQEMIALATELAKKQLREGTAKSQVIVHYLKLASSRERLEQEHINSQLALNQAKIENMRSAQEEAAKYDKVLAAMKEYGGHYDDEDIS